MEEARRAAETAARTSYGRLVAYLAARSRDVAAAEDALSDAFRAALEAWPARGVPDRPEAWLLAAARRRLVDHARHAGVRAAAAASLKLLAEEEPDATGPDFPDERLKLLFVCAHPAIEPASRTCLMLQTVLGLDAARIGSAFLVSPAAMGQRLVRAKAKIRDAGIAFEVPEADELAPRLEAVLEAVYAAYGTGWDDAAGSDARRSGLAEEAVYLGRQLVALAPDQPEARGLLALMLFCEARRPARRSRDGAYVPLDRQDVRLWSRPLVAEAEAQLAQAVSAKSFGRFQLEAAIQSAHTDRMRTGRVDWSAVAGLYDGLIALAPALGALVGRAAALAEAQGPAAGLAALDAVPADRCSAYQPYWAVRAHLLAGLGRAGEAAAAYARAIGLTEDPAARAFLIARASAAEVSSDLYRAMP